MSKFKTGDVIIYSSTHYPHLKGKKFKIVKVEHDGRHACESMEPFFDGHDCAGLVRSGRGWWINESEMTADPKRDEITNGFIVCLTENGNFLPSKVPFIHTKLTDAITEAKRLSEKYGQRFTVLGANYTTLVKVEKTETQQYL